MQVTPTSTRAFPSTTTGSASGRHPIVGASSGAPRLVRALGLGLFVALATPAIALGSAAAAAAAPGAVVSNPGIVDSDGTMGTIDYDGTMGDMAPAMSGSQRMPATTSTGHFQITSDICYQVSKGCLFGDNYGPHTISAISGVKDGPGSDLNNDGF